MGSALIVICVSFEPHSIQQEEIFFLTDWQNVPEFVQVHCEQINLFVLLHKNVVRMVHDRGSNSLCFCSYVSILYVDS